MTECDPRARPWGRRIGRKIGLPRQITNCKADTALYRGTLNEWYSARLSGWFATVELPKSRAVTTAMISRSVASIQDIAASIPDYEHAS